MSALNQLPPNIQEKLNRLQQLQSTLQQLVLQKQRLDLERSESERALKLIDSVASDKKVKVWGTLTGDGVLVADEIKAFNASGGGIEKTWVTFRGKVQ